MASDTNPGQPDDPLRGVPLLQTDLISDGSVPAANTDPHLINPWGISFSAAGPFWISDAGTGVTTIYNGDGVPFPVAGQLAIAIGTPEGATFPAIPTGQVFNGGTGGFVVGEGAASASWAFLFATVTGTISGWSPAVDVAHSIVAVDDSASHASYTGLAIAATDAGKRLYAADFHNGEVAVFDADFHKLAPIADPSLPDGYAPFNVQVLAGHLFVAFAQQDPATGRDLPGAGHGYVDEFALNGTLLRHIAANGPLDSPWGLALAPGGGFGPIEGDLLVGNFGDGTVSVFDRNTDAFLGKLSDADGNAIQNDFLWALAVGNGGNAGKADQLYFTAGIGGEEHGLFGSLSIDWNALAAHVQANFAATGQWFV